MILYICFPLNSTVWLFPPRDFVIQPELLKLQVPVLLMLNLCKISLRLISSPAFIALSWAGALCYSRFQWFRPNHWNLWSQAPEPQDSRESISFNGAKRFWAWYFNAPSPVVLSLFLKFVGTTAGKKRWFMCKRLLISNISWEGAFAGCVLSLISVVYTPEN